MTFKAAACPNCSAAIEVPDDRNTVKCAYCSSHVVVREASPAVAAPVPPTVIYQPVQVFPANQYRCPLCGSPHPPQIVKRVSAFGWVVFVFGLAFFIIGCLLGLLFKKEVRVCPSCKGTLPPPGMRHTASAVSGSYTGQFAAPKATPRWVWWVGGLFVLGAIGAAIDEQVKQAKSNQSSTVNTPISASSSATPQGSTGREITSAERLSEAKNSLADNRLADTRRALEAIKPGDPEYAEAQALLEQVKRREGRRRR